MMKRYRITLFITFVVLALMLIQTGTSAAYQLGWTAIQHRLSAAVITNEHSGSWTSMSMTNAPAFRYDIRPASVETKLIVLAFKNDFSADYTGDIYDPGSDSWAPMSMTGAPAFSTKMSAVSVGTKLIVMGYKDPPPFFGNTGGIYDPGSDSWTPMSTTGSPSFEFIDFAVPIGTRLIVLGNTELIPVENVGGIYDPGSDSWAPMSMTGAPFFDDIGSAVPVGTRLIVEGYKSDPVDPDAGENVGSIYDPGSNSWTPMSMTGAPSFEFIDFAVPIGTRLIVLGNKFDPVDPDAGENVGGIYDPGSDSWAPMSMTGAPSFDFIDFAVSVGTKLIVFGYDMMMMMDNVGGIYDPGSDSWAPMSMTGAPSFDSIGFAVPVVTKLIVLGTDMPLMNNVGSIYELVTKIDPNLSWILLLLLENQ
jgi:predicted cupin superfamily sugar epimerase